MDKSEKEKKDTFANSNIFKTLSTFSKSELRAFDKFVSSPFHNNRSELIPFWKEIKKFCPAFAGEEFTKEKVFSSICPGQKFRDDVIRRLCSNLFKLSEEYLAYDFYRKNAFDFDKSLLEQYFIRDLDRLYNRQLARTRSSLEHNPLRNAEYYERVSGIEEIDRFHLAKRDTTAKRTTVQKQIESVWQYSVITLLRLYINAIQYNNQFNSKHDISQLSFLLQIVENPAFKKSRSAEMFYLSYNHDRVSTPKLYNDLKRLNQYLTYRFLIVYTHYL